MRTGLSCLGKTQHLFGAHLSQHVEVPVAQAVRARGLLLARVAVQDVVITLRRYRQEMSLSLLTAGAIGGIRHRG